LVKKPRRAKQRGVRASYLVSAVVVVILVAAGGWYYLSSSGGQTSTSTTTSASISCPNPPASVISNLVYAKIETTFGTIEVELYPTAAPQTVANFVNLSKTGFYNNLVWHRIVNAPKPFVIQTGDPITRNGGGDRAAWGTGGSGKTVPLETSPSLHNYVCYLGMARGQDANSGTSQFYIDLADNTALDGSYTVFGRVVSGMNVVSQIAAVPVNSTNQPITPVFMLSVTILSGGP
jgi:cyclophilin family peptidyl-prolyl cis-trans isomerase